MTPTTTAKFSNVVRRPRRFVASCGIVIAALVAGTLAWGSPANASGNEFLASSYGTSVSDSEGSYCWRGWGFELNQNIDVTALIGGGYAVETGASFAVAIWEATYDSGTDTITFGDVMAEADFPSAGAAEQTAVLPTPVSLTTGQVYVMGMGSTTQSGGSSDMYKVNQFNSAEIAGPSALFSQWISPADTRAFSLGIGGEDCGGSPSAAVGTSLVVGDNDTSTNPAIGFAYAATPEPTTTTTAAPEPLTPAFTG